MTNEVSRTIDAVAFAAADLVTPITVLHAAGRFLLTEMDETDLLRWETTQAVGAIAAAQKSIQEATEKLMFMVTKDAELQAETVDRSGLTMWERPSTACDEDGCALSRGHAGDHYADDEYEEKPCPAVNFVAGAVSLQQVSCELTLGHTGPHEAATFEGELEVWA